MITLTSDIGTRDYLVGAIKGRLWRLLPQAVIADVSHSVAPFNYNEAAYFVRSAFPHFPENTWHLILVNVFEAPQPRFLVARAQGHFFAGPDNGLIPMILDGEPQEAIALPDPASGEPGLLPFVDLVARAKSAIDAGATLTSLGPQANNMVEKNSLRPGFGADWIEGRIIYIDRFENVVTNITRADFESVRSGRSFQIAFKSDDIIEQISDHYGSVGEGDKLAWFNTAGYLEIAVNKGNAAGLFGLQAIGSEASQQFLKSRMFYQTVRIFFK